VPIKNEEANRKKQKRHQPRDTPRVSLPDYALYLNYMYGIVTTIRAVVHDSPPILMPSATPLNSIVSMYYSIISLICQWKNENISKIYKRVKLNINI